MVDFWCRFFHGLVPIFFTVYADFSRFIRDINVEKKKHLVIQKKRGVHKISARNSGAGSGCTNFMGAWHFWFFQLENPPWATPIKLRLLGGGVLGFLRGVGWKRQFYFYGRGDFSSLLMIFFTVSFSRLRTVCNRAGPI